MNGNPLARGRGSASPARGAVLAAAIIYVCVLVQCRMAPEGPAPREENYVTVNLNDSLNRYDKVVVQILAAGDTAAVVGTLWTGRLTDPRAIPSYRLDDGETRVLSVRVRAWDATGRLVLDERIAKQDGKTVVTAVAIPEPSPRLASLSLSAGSLSPAFAPATPAYSASVPYAQGSVQVTAAPEYAEARLFVGIRPVMAGKPSDPVPLDTGINRITVLVLAADTSAQYVLTVMRARPPADTAKPVPTDTGKVPGDTSKPVPTDTGKTVPPDTVKTPANPFPDWKFHGAVVLRLPSAGTASPHAIAADFPLLLRLTAANFRFSEAADSGRDLRFLDVNGKSLDFAVARWDTAAQLADIYLRCDTLSPDRAAPVYSMYWGNPKAASAANPSALFPRSRGWTGVWHLDESGSGRSGEYRDATGSFPGTALLKFPKQVGGVVGFAQDFDGNGGQSVISLPSAFDPGINHYTMHMWVYYESRAAAYLFIKSGLGADDQRFEVDATQGTSEIAFGRTGTGGSRYVTAFGAPPQVWFQLGIVCDGDSVHLYDNGVEMEAHPFKLGGDPSANVVLGARNPNGDAGFPGRMDEFWSFDGARDAWYMRLIYENQKSGSTMATLSPL